MIGHRRTDRPQAGRSTGALAGAQAPETALADPQDLAIQRVWSHVVLACPQGPRADRHAAPVDQAPGLRPRQTELVGDQARQMDNSVVRLEPGLLDLRRRAALHEDPVEMLLRPLG